MDHPLQVCHSKWTPGILMACDVHISFTGEEGIVTEVKLSPSNTTAISYVCLLTTRMVAILSGDVLHIQNTD
jgi:hypothetical protein